MVFENIEKAKEILVSSIYRIANGPIAQFMSQTVIIEDEDWGGEVYLHDDREEIDRALGTGRDDYGLISVWWD